MPGVEVDDFRRTAKREFAAEQFVQRYTQAVLVAGRGDIADVASGLFGRHVGGRPHQGAVLRQFLGRRVFGPQDVRTASESFWKDRKGAGLNAIRTRTLLRQADVVVVRFGPKYRQWNAAFDAGFAAALGKPLITLHDAELDNALKEIDAVACATTRDPDQVVKILHYVIEQV